MFIGASGMRYTESSNNNHKWGNDMAVKTIPVDEWGKRPRGKGKTLVQRTCRVSGTTELIPFERTFQRLVLYYPDGIDLATRLRALCDGDVIETPLAFYQLHTIVRQ